jgi:hypothetical protein
MSPPRLGSKTVHESRVGGQRVTIRYFSNRPSQVGSRTGARTVGGGFPAALFRLCRGITIPPWSRLQLPPRQTQHADFPHCAFLPASSQGVCDLFDWERFRSRPTPPLSVVVGLRLGVYLPPPVLQTAGRFSQGTPAAPLALRLGGKCQCRLEKILLCA